MINCLFAINSSQLKKPMIYMGLIHRLKSYKNRRLITTNTPKSEINQMLLAKPFRS